MATILLVDDVELFLELERSYFEGTEHVTVCASSGTEALARIEEQRPDIVLLDLYMPDLDGAEVCRRIRALPDGQALPVIMVTAAGKEEEIRRCIQAGCDDYVTKPVNRKELLEKLNRLLGELRYRTEPRAAVALPATLIYEGQPIRAMAQDLSANGAFLQTTALLPLGTSFDLCIDLESGESLTIPARVKGLVNGETGGAGVYFIKPPARVQRFLEQLSQPIREEAPEEALAEIPLDSLRQEVNLLRRRQVSFEEERRRLDRRIAELEDENREFAEHLVQVEEINNNLSNLYIASSRLHSMLDRHKVSEIIKEIIINFVGAEKFAVLLLAEDRQELRYETGEGFEPQAFPAVRTGEGLLGEVLASGESYFFDGSVSDGSDDPLRPLAAIPLKIQGHPMGLLAVYRLFIQKERFAPIDYQLFSMLAEHAATALFSASLYEVSERKRQTYRGFMDLLLQQ